MNSDDLIRDIELVKIFNKKKKCPSCKEEIEVFKYYTTICPLCKKCSHWTMYGSDHRCDCGKAHHWWGIGWRILNEDGTTKEWVKR